MAQVAQPVEGISEARRALLGVRVALERQSPRDFDREHPLEPELAKLGVTFGESLDAYSQLQAAAEHVGQEGPQYVHPLHLAFATMGLRRRDGLREDRQDQLREVARALIKPEASAEGAHVDAVHNALEGAHQANAQERWKQVHQSASSSLVTELAVIEKVWCQSDLQPVENEWVSRVETYMLVKSDKTLDDIAPAMLPDNWPSCNDFFCSLTRRPERDDSADTTGGNLSTGLAHWRGVYEERVGQCPDGWFPDTFLLFTWDRFENTIILRYELAPRRANDRTVIRIDEGYIQLTRLPAKYGLPGKYEVTTQKCLLFDDRILPAGGQALGMSACQLGWLDHALTQFTDCAAGLSHHPGPTLRPGAVGAPGSNLDAGLQRVLAQCADHLRESATSAEAQLRKVMSKISGGSYGLNDFVDDWGEAVMRVMRDGARLLLNQQEYAAKSLELATSFAPTREKKP